MRIEFRTEPEYSDLPDGRTRRLLNDYLYKIGRMNRAKITRSQADEIFLAAMVALDVPAWQRRAMYAGVRIGAWRAWGCYRDADIYREAWGLE